MDDLERYGDYNEIDEAPGGKKSPVGFIIKILILLVCISVFALLVFRMVLFNTYPDSMKRIYFTDSLTAFYNERGGDIEVLTQKLRFAYDDADEGNFFCDNLILVREAGQLQVCVRFNTSLMADIEEKYGVKLDPDNTDIFSFSLAKTKSGYVDDGGKVETESIGTLQRVDTDSRLMYRYYKLSFDEVDFGLGEGQTEVAWIRLEIRINGVEMEEPYKILVYENHEGYSEFEEYKLGGEERPS